MRGGAFFRPYRDYRVLTERPTDKSVGYDLSSLPGLGKWCVNVMGGGRFFRDFRVSAARPTDESRMWAILVRPCRDSEAASRLRKLTVLATRC